MHCNDCRQVIPLYVHSDDATVIEQIRLLVSEHGNCAPTSNLEVTLPDADAIDRVDGSERSHSTQRSCETASPF